MPSPKDRAEKYVAEGRLDDLRKLRLSLVNANKENVAMYNRYEDLIAYCDEHLPGTQEEPEQPAEGDDAPAKPKKKKKKAPGKKGGTPKQN